MASITKTAAIISCLLLLCGCEPPQSAPIRIGANVWPGYEAIFLARTKGFYELEGVRVELVEFGSLPDVRRAFERGQIDAMATTVIEVIQVREFSNRRPQVFLISDYSDGADVVLGTDDVDSITALKGRKVGAEPASLGVFLLTRALEEHGLSLDDVKVMPMDQSNMRTALAEGRVDAIVTYPPVSARTQADGARVLFTSSEILHEVVDVLSVDASILQHREADIAAIIRAWDRAVAYMRAEPSDANRINAARTGMTPAGFAQSLDGIRITNSREQAAAWQHGGALQRAVQTAARVLRDAGQIDGPDETADVLAPGPIGTVSAAAP